MSTSRFLDLDLDYDDDRLDALFPRCPPKSPNASNGVNRKKKSIAATANLIDLNRNANNAKTASAKHVASVPTRQVFAQGNMMYSPTEESPPRLDPWYNEDVYPPGSGPSLPPHSSSSASSSSVSSASVRSSTTGAISADKRSRDTKIEIAGGRELFSQSRSRRKRDPAKRDYQNFPSGTNGGGNRMTSRKGGAAYQVYEQQQPDVEAPPVPQPAVPSSSIRETVFASEIHSIEYKSADRLVYDDGASAASNVLFDDIGDQCDVNVTYDLIDGGFPPPNGLSVRSSDHVDLLSSGTPTKSPKKVLNPTLVPAAGSSQTTPVAGAGVTSFHRSTESLDNLYLGEEALHDDDSIVSQSSSTSYQQTHQPPPSHRAVIGGITIDEYEGSPRRYRPRKAGDDKVPGLITSSVNDLRQDAEANATLTCSTKSSPSDLRRKHPLATRSTGGRLPGFPQRVLPPATTSSNEERPQREAEKQKDEEKTPKEQSEPTEELLKFDELVTPLPPQPPHTTQPQEQSDEKNKSDSYDYRYEFSETRKVLDEFFKAENEYPAEEKPEEKKDEFSDLDYTLRRRSPGNSYVGQRLAGGEEEEEATADLVDLGAEQQQQLVPPQSSTPSSTLQPQVGLSPLDSPLVSIGNSPAQQQQQDIITSGATRQLAQAESNGLEEQQKQTCAAAAPIGAEQPPPQLATAVEHSRNFTLSPETTDCDSADLESELSINEGSYHSSGPRLHTSMPVLEDGLSSGHASDIEEDVIYSSSGTSVLLKKQPTPQQTSNLFRKQMAEMERELQEKEERGGIKILTDPSTSSSVVHNAINIDVTALPSTSAVPQDDSVAAALKDIKMAIQATKVLHSTRIPSAQAATQQTMIPVMPPAATPTNADQPDDPWVPRGHPAPMLEQSDNLELDDEDDDEDDESESEIVEERVPTPKNVKEDDDLDTDQETDRLLGQQYNDDNGYYDTKNEAAKKKTAKTKEAVTDPKVLIEGVLFRARYLGSTQLVCEGQPTKATRMMQAEEAVSRIKAPEGETQPSTEVDLFISTEKIMVLNTDLKEIMMDHALRSISYIADIGDLLVIMARRRIVPTEGEEMQVIGTTPKMICHVFESEEAQFIAQSIGQAFQVAYMEFLKANGIEDHSFVKEMDYQEVLNSQEIYGNELQMFARKELQKEVVVPKAKGEILGVVIVESGWGSMLPTIVLANLSPAGPAARCGQLNIGDQVIAINGISLVGLPLSTCQHYIKNTKNTTAVKLTAVSCAPVVEVKIKRPDTKYQLGFSVQNGVICSLLRGGIAERGGVRVGHRIIEINGQSVVAVPHEKIVNLLATSVGEITMKTMPTAMFRLLTGQETPNYI